MKIGLKAEFVKRIFYYNSQNKQNNLTDLFNLYIEFIAMNIYNIVIGASKNTKGMLFMKI